MQEVVPSENSVDHGEWLDWYKTMNTTLVLLSVRQAVFMLKIVIGMVMISDLHDYDSITQALPSFHFKLSQVNICSAITLYPPRVFPFVSLTSILLRIDFTQLT